MFGALFFRTVAGCLMRIVHLWNSSLQHLGSTFKRWNVKESVIGQFALKYLNKSLHAGYRNYALHKTTITNKLNHAETRISV